MRPQSTDALPRRKWYIRAFDSAGIFCWGFQVWAINLEQAQVSADTFARVEPRYRFDVEEVRD